MSDLAGLIATPEGPRPPVQGLIHRAPASVGDTVRVLVPGFSGDHFYEVDHWDPRGVALPQVGDKALLIFDEDGEPWLLWDGAYADPPPEVIPAARVYNSANISIPNATLTALTFNSERFDNDSIHSTASNTSRLTATTAGVYSISGNFTMAPLGSGVGLIGVRLNGSLIIAYQRFAGITATNLIQAIQTTYKLDVGDYVELIAHQDSGSALNVIAASNYSPEFSMHKVSDG